ANRPVGTNHQSRRTEAFECHIQIRYEILFRPVVPIGFGNQARELAVDVLKLCQSAKASRPHAELATPYIRLREMIKNEALAFETSHEFRCYRQMPRIYKDVVRKVEFLKHCDSPPEIRPHQEPIVGFALDNMTNAGQL